MENLEHEFVYIHQELIKREALTSQALRQLHAELPPFIDRASTSMGDLLIRIGTRLKDRTHTKMTTEDASSPSYLIML